MLQGAHGAVSGLSASLEAGPDAHAQFAAALPIPANQTFHVYRGPQHNGAAGVASAGLLGQRFSLLGSGPSAVVLGGTNVSTDMWSFIDLDMTVGLPALVKASIKRAIPAVDHLVLDRVLSFTHKLTTTVASVTARSKRLLPSPPLAAESAAACALKLPARPQPTNAPARSTSRASTSLLMSTVQAEAHSTCSPTTTRW